jgi:hypothetical protein
MRILFLMVFLPTLCAAQVDWAPVGAKWWYGLTMFAIDFSSTESYYSMEVVEEVEMQGRTCRRLSFGHLGQDCFTCSSMPLYVYSDSGRVYYFNHEEDEFLLLYDMNKGIGESWDVRFTGLDGETTITLTVIDTMSIVVNGIRLRQQQVNLDNWYLLGDVITEGIGGSITFFPICANASGHCESSYPGLRCYQDSVVGLFPEGIGLNSCEWTTPIGIEERDKGDVKVWPNPSSESFRFQVRGLRSTDIILTATDMQGRAFPLEKGVAEGRGISSEGIVSMDVSRWPNGIYLITLTDNDGNRHTQRLVVLH